MARPVSQGGIDYPDGGLSASGLIYALRDDLGELAARLGSIVTYNREGIVVALEDFSYGMAAWGTVGSGNGAEAIISNTAYRSAPYSCKMVPGSTSGYSITIRCYFPLPALGTYGLELSFQMVDTADRVQWYIIHRDGARAHYYGLQYEHASGELQLYDPDVTWLTIATGLDLNDPTVNFNTVKTVVDLLNETHLRTIVNGSEYNTSAYGPLDATDDDGPSLEVRVNMLDESGGQGYIYVDDIVQTVSEPEH